MSQTKADRLRQARIFAKFHSASEAARSLGVSTPTYIHHENGTRDFSTDAARLYALRFHVSLPWLLLGAGEMSSTHMEEVRDKDAEVRDAALEAESRSVFDLGAGYDVRSRKAATRFRKADAVPMISPSFSRTDLDGVKEDFVWKRHVGVTETVNHEVTGFFGFPQNFIKNRFGSDAESTITFPIIGDAMSPSLKNGDIAILDTGIQDFIVDGLYLISDGTSNPEIRRVQKVLFSDPMMVRLSADDEKISPFEAQVDALQIIGIVRGKITSA
ncbi:S24 family peptidase [Ochrobactrum sp. S1502_03]|uniref:S24 family peptidase n=1 Tax=Ochrobactrum sp. S1502_03 TaxID=3108451 RepID=UPI0037CC1CDE